MKTRIISVSDLTEVGKWRADLHVHSDSEIKSDRFELLAISEIVVESKQATAPADVDGKFYYIGLEHVEPITGDGNGIELVTAESVRSRSKVFEEGDILYGRLRPYLRKAFYVEGQYKQGLCSTEFVVLKPKKDMVLPLFLREILVSDMVTELVTRMQGGAALPRISSKDLLGIKVPVPPLSYQMECVAKIEKARSQRHELLQKIEALSREGSRVVQEVFS
ncbi:MAG: restriction endonuclease subunit S [Akkermansiaceae bacterium]|nr:restriction endonuclease subunit S [Akkermansiaceae bacterium]